jgi:4-diphosphocytidyl-2-C-methyl-D-erythritol kinase
MVSFPPCKINLGLHVTRKREDGYHELETCFYPVPWTDILEVIKSDVFSFTSSGTPIPGDPNQNLCIKAYDLMKAAYDLPPVRIHLHKIIPTGAGLGGGSSDAAHTLRLLADLFELDIPSDRLMEFAARLGSDCAFFVQDEPRLGIGRGEILTPISVSLRGKYIVLVKPDIHVSTADAYAGIQPAPAVKPLSEILAQRPGTWKEHLKNDFEKSVFKRFPAIEPIKIRLYNEGAVYASMSGSGSTVFGLFEQEVSLQNIFRDATVWSGILS